MLNFLAKTENLRNTRSKQPIYNRGKVLEKSSGILLFAISRYKSNEKWKVTVRIVPTLFLTAFVYFGYFET